MPLVPHRAPLVLARRVPLAGSTDARPFARGSRAERPAPHRLGGRRRRRPKPHPLRSAGAEGAGSLRSSARPPGGLPVPTGGPPQDAAPSSARKAIGAQSHPSHAPRSLPRSGRRRPGAPLRGPRMRQVCPPAGAPHWGHSVHVPRSAVSALVSLLASAAPLGVSGSRQPGPACLGAVRWALAQRPSGATVVTGCASGIDGAARLAVPSAVVLRASAFRASGVPAHAALARRSVAAVQLVASGPAGLWLSAPGRACPRGLAPSASPSACFSGSGSGSWASLAFALGFGVRALVWLPSGVSPPPWGLVSAGSGQGGGWWRSSAPVQTSLF